MNDNIEKHLYRKVLVVDDNEVDRYIAVRNITKYFFAEEVITKESAKKALDYLNSLAVSPDDFPDLIFVDIRMPEMDGFGFLDEYEKLPDSIKTKCIIMMLSTSLNPGDREKAEGNKFVKKFLNKPLDKDKLSSLK